MFLRLDALKGSNFQAKEETKHVSFYRHPIVFLRVVAQQERSKPYANKEPRRVFLRVCARAPFFGFFWSARGANPLLKMTAGVSWSA